LIELIRFADFVEINPKVELKRGEEYPFIDMAIVEPGRRYVRSIENRIYSGGGSKFSSGDVLFARITPCLENGKIVQFKDNNERNGF
jgi:type I restriction enzyme S subunit